MVVARVNLFVHRSYWWAGVKVQLPPYSRALVKQSLPNPSFWPVRYRNQENKNLSIFQASVAYQPIDMRDLRH